MHWRRKWQPTPVFLPGESQGRRGPVGCCLWGRTELDTTEATWQQQWQQQSTSSPRKEADLFLQNNSARSTLHSACWKQEINISVQIPTEFCSLPVPPISSMIYSTCMLGTPPPNHLPSTYLCFGSVWNSQVTKPLNLDGFYSHASKTHV